MFSIYHNIVASDLAVRCASAKLNHEAFHNFEQIKKRLNVRSYFTMLLLISCSNYFNLGTFFYKSDCCHEGFLKIPVCQLKFLERGFDVLCSLELTYLWQLRVVLLLHTQHCIAGEIDRREGSKSSGWIWRPEEGVHPHPCP